MRRKGAEMCWMCDHPEATAEEYLDEVYGIMLMHGGRYSTWSASDGHLPTRLV